MNEDKSNLEQQSYSNQEVKQQLRDIRNQQGQVAAQNVIKGLKHVPQTKAVGEALDKADTISGGRLSNAAGKISNSTAEGRTLNRIASNPLATRALNAMDFNKGKNAQNIKDNFSEKGKDIGDKGKGGLEKNKPKTSSSSKSINSKKDNSNNPPKTSDLDNKKNNDFQSTDKSDLEKKVIKGDTKQTIKDFAVTVFGGTPMMIAVISIFIFLLIFVILFVTIYVSIEDKEEKIKTMVISEVTSAETQAVIRTPINDPATNLTIYGITKLAEKLGSDINNYTKYKEKYGNYFKLFLNIGNNFSSQISTCKGDECESRVESRFYQKIADITYRYKKLYNIELDWPLITSAIIFNSNNKEEVFAANLSYYTESEVRDLDNVMSLDWDYDYKNISDYDYLSGKDSRYDLQILAKNMVKKTITQTCTDSKGNNIVEPLVLEDVEDYLIDEKLNNGNYLVCDTKKYEYTKTVNYTYDKDKFNDFLDEYLEMKYFENKNGGSSNDSGGGTIPYGHDMASTMLIVAKRELGNGQADSGKKYWSVLWNKKLGGWCACFVAWVTLNTEFNGVHLSPDIVKLATGSPAYYMSYFINSSDSNINFHYNTNTSKYASKGEKYIPKQGDFIFFSGNCLWDGNPSTITDKGGIVSHIGIVDYVEGNNIHTVEGNHGNKVATEIRKLDSCTVLGFGSWY